MGKLTTYQCPACGGALKFESSLGSVKCQYCDTVFTKEDLQAYNDEIQQTPEENTEWKQGGQEWNANENNYSQYICTSCGGEIFADENTASTLCPFCNNPVILNGRLQGSLKPDYVIPFQYDKEQVVNLMQQHFKKKFLVPKAFRQENVLSDTQSLYVPFWLFDADVMGSVDFRAQTTRRWSDANYNYKETRHYSLIRRGSIAFDHVPVDGSQKMPDDLMESIEPFDFTEAKEFDASYLAGHPADKYDVDQETTFKRANVRIGQGVIDAFRKTVSPKYSAVSVKKSSLTYVDNKANYALYPVWVLHTKWRDKQYTFGVNGQSGKVVGNLPVSPLKLILMSMIAFLLAGFIFFGIAFLAVEDGDLALGLVGGCLFGAIAFGITCWRLLHTMHVAVHKQWGCSDYYRPDSMDMISVRDIFLYSTVSKTPRPQNNNNNNGRHR